jgi:hypothetical protein
MARAKTPVEAEVSEEPPEVDARPTKKFFVRMLVRDIELAPAIIDLIDNSVDGAKRLAGAAGNSSKDGGEEDDSDSSNGTAVDLSSHEIRLSFNAEEFVIEDDCGGIELEDAVGYAFRFGRPDDVDTFDGEVGQFGVGMKRALFKIGESFTVTSIAPTSSFELAIDVPKWLEDEEDWSFPLVDAKDAEANPPEKLSTRIVVSRLLPSVASEFQEDAFVQRLRSQIEFRHQPALAAGLTIKLNDDDLHSRPLELLLKPGELEPRVVDKELSTNGQSVRMRLYAGFVELGDADAETDDPDKFSGGSQAGWYVICNGRMLLFANKDRLTGWGQEVADYHPQYRRFRGYVYLSGPAALMPWNTAKTYVDEDSPIWVELRKEIVDALREARTVMNRIKSEVQERPAPERPLSAALDEAEETPLSDLPASSKMVVPAKPPKQPSTTKGIKYDVPVELFDEVAGSLGVSTAVDVGRGTFDYYYSRELED